MYPVSDEYKAAIKENTREFQLVITIFPADNFTIKDVEQILATVVKGVDDSEVTINVNSIEDIIQVLSTVVQGVETPDEYVLHDNDIVTKTFKLADSIVCGEDIEWGNVISKDLSFTLTNYEGQWNNVDLTRATIVPMIGLKVGEGYEYVPMGTFWADTVKKISSTVSIKAFDEMARLSVPFSEIPIEYPCTLGTIFFQICDHCGIRTKITSFPNDTVTAQPDSEDLKDLSCRDVLSYIAQIAGCSFRMSRDNYLERVCYGQENETTLYPQNRMSFKPEDFTIRITGIEYEDSDDNVYLAGKDDYVIKLSSNPFMPSDPTDVLNTLFELYADFAHQPFTLEYFGDPAIDCGDRITNVHTNGKKYSSYITNNTFTLKGACTLLGKGRLPEVSQSPTKESKQSQKMVALIKKQQKESERHYSSLEKAILSATTFFTQELGGYVLKTEDVIYIMDTKDINTATKVWKWSLGGLGYSEHGVNGPYTTAITMDGAIVADFITAGVLSADRIKGGTLKLGGNNNVDGIFEIYDSDNKLIAIMDKQGLRIFNGNFTVYKGDSTSTDKTIYLDSDGNASFVGYLTQPNSTIKAIVGKNPLGNPGFFVYRFEDAYKKTDGTYKPYLEFWTSASQETNITGINSIVFVVEDMQDTKFLSLKCLPTGGKLYGAWDFNQNQYFSYNIGTAYGFVLQASSDSTRYGSLYVNTNHDVVLNSDPGNEVHLSTAGKTAAGCRHEWDIPKFFINNYDLRKGSNIVVDNVTVAQLFWSNDSDVARMCLRMNSFGWGVSVGGSYKITINSAEGHLYGSWYGSSSQAIPSDATKKHSIESLDNRYSTFFDKLSAIRYKYNDGTSDRYHTGFISQYVEQALIESGLDSSEFAGFIKTEKQDYYLRYEEFIALAINEIQILKKDKQNLEQKVIDLESKVSELTQTLNTIIEHLNLQKGESNLV